MRTATVLAALLLLLAAPAAMAAKPDRAGAEGLAAAAKQLRAGVLAKKAPLETVLLRLERDPVCDQAIRGVPDDENAFGAAADVLIDHEFEALIFPIRDELARFTADLGAVALRDPVLRSGRAAQRRTYRRFVAVGEPPPDICAQLDAWRQAGYPAASAPKIDDPALDAIFDHAKQLQRDTEKINRAGRRLRKLGVSKRLVNIWNGDDTTLFKGIDTGDSELHIGDGA